MFDIHTYEKGYIYIYTFIYSFCKYPPPFARAVKYVVVNCNCLYVNFCRLFRKNKSDTTLNINRYDSPLFSFSPTNRPKINRYVVKFT